MKRLNAYLSLNWFKHEKQLHFHSSLVVKRCFFLWRLNLKLHTSPLLRSFFRWICSSSLFCVFEIKGKKRGAGDHKTFSRSFFFSNSTRDITKIQTAFPVLKNWNKKCLHASNAVTISKLSEIPSKTKEQKNEKRYLWRP